MSHLTHANMNKFFWLLRLLKRGQKLLVDPGQCNQNLKIQCPRFFDLSNRRHRLQKQRSLSSALAMMIALPKGTGYCLNGYSKIWWDTSWDINRYKQINDTLLRQRITAGSATDLLWLGLSAGHWSLVIRSKRRLEMVSFHKFCSGYTIIKLGKPLVRLLRSVGTLYT